MKKNKNNKPITKHIHRFILCPQEIRRRKNKYIIRVKIYKKITLIVIQKEKNYRKFFECLQ